MVSTPWTPSTGSFFRISDLGGSTRMFLICSNASMTDRPASWRMPTPGQMEKLAAVGREPRTTRAPGPADEMPPEYWESLLNDPRADARPDRSGASIRTQRLSEIPQHILRVSCARCGRIVEIQKADAVRVAGPQAVWKDVGQRLLDDTCQQRTGRLEEDGCWPAFK